MPFESDERLVSIVVSAVREVRTVYWVLIMARRGSRSFSGEGRCGVSRRVVANGLVVLLRRDDTIGLMVVVVEGTVWWLRLRRDDTIGAVGLLQRLRRSVVRKQWSSARNGRRRGGYSMVL